MKISIKSKILFLFLIISFLSVSTLLLITYQGMQRQGEYAVSRSHELGLDAANRSRSTLEAQTRTNLIRLVGIQAELSNDFFRDIETQVDIIARLSPTLFPEPSPQQKTEHSRPEWINQLKTQSANDSSHLLRIAPGTSFEQVADEWLGFQRLGHIFQPLLVKDRDIEQIFVGTQQGLNLLWPRESGEASDRYDPRTRAWYIDALKQNQRVWTDVFQAASTDKLLVACAAPVYQPDGTVKGVVGLTVSIEGLKHIISSQTKDIGYAFLLDRQGRVVARPGISEAEWVADWGHQALGEAENSVIRGIVMPMMSQRSDFSRIMLNSGEKFIGYAPIAATGWSVAVVISANEALQLATDTEHSIIAATEDTQAHLDRFLQNTKLVMAVAFITILLLVLLVSVRFSNRISNPILALSDRVRVAGSGDLDTRINIKTGDEIEQLCDGFNKMMRDLKAHIEEVKRVTSEKEKIESELKIARSIQASMLPSHFPAYPERDDFDIYASMVPAKEVGGDLYDFFLVDENRLCIVIGDVSGKGITAALFMVRALTLLRNEALRQKETVCPGRVLSMVNDALAENNDECLFVTTFVAVIDLSTGVVEFSSAGHNPPMLKKATADGFSYLETEKNFVLGPMEGFSYKKEQLKLQAGDIFFLYTDGVTEAMDSANRLYSDERLRQTASKIKEQSPEGLVHGVIEDIADFVKDTPASDDITMLVFNYSGN